MTLYDPRIERAAMSTFDPEVEAGAIALAWIARPGAIVATREAWWEAIGDHQRDQYRYRASIVLEAVDELRSIPHAAE